MPHTANPKVLIVGPTEEAVQPPIRSGDILVSFRRFDCPFSLENTRKVKKLLHHNFGEGYFQVYSPANAQRMKIYFKGWIETDWRGRIV